MILWKKIVAVRPEIQYYGFDIRTGNGIGRGIRLTHCMTDSGNVVITPDGSLYSCEHCSQESRFGIFRDDKMGGGGTGSQSTHYVFFERIFSNVELTEEDMFIDVGCGKGRSHIRSH